MGPSLVSWWLGLHASHRLPHTRGWLWAGTSAGAPRGSTHEQPRHGLGVLTAWQLGPKSGTSRDTEPGGSSVAFSNVALGITRHSFHHILIVRSSPHSNGGGLRLYLLMDDAPKNLWMFKTSQLVLVRGHRCTDQMTLLLISRNKYSCQVPPNICVRSLSR